MLYAELSTSIYYVLQIRIIFPSIESILEIKVNLTKKQHIGIWIWIEFI